MKQISIHGVDYSVYGANESATNPNTHIVEVFTGNIPEGKQRGLLLEYLRQNGVDPINGATTHWCINKVLKLGVNNDKDLNSKKPEQKYLPITEENIEEQHKLVQASSNYGKEGLIIHDVLNAFPLNNDLNTIAMKIAVIDVTNSTHLSQYKSRINTWRVNFDYESFNRCVGKLLDEHHIHIPFRRRKFDHFLWYANK